MVLDLVISPLTSSFGAVLFGVLVGGILFERVVRATAPFIIPLIVVLALIAVIPSLVTWVPSMVMGK